METTSDVVVRLLKAGSVAKFLEGTNALTGASVRVPVGSPAVAEAIKTAKKNDYLLVTIKTVECAKPFSRTISATAAQAYAPKPGEDEPGCYVFESSLKHKVGKAEVPAIRVSKFRKETLFLMPQAKDSNAASGEPAGTEVTVAALKAGDPVEIVAAESGNPDRLKAIKAYEPPRDGICGKIGTETVGRLTYTSVEIHEAAGNALTCMVPLGEAGASIREALRTLKEGDSLKYKTCTDTGGRTLLVLLIKAAPAPDKVTQNSDRSIP